MEQISLIATDNFRKDIPVNFSQTKAVEKGIPQKNFFEKKCVHRTASGFCKRSNKQCILLNL